MFKLPYLYQHDGHHVGIDSLDGGGGGKTRTLILDPVSRVEGDIAINVEIKSDGRLEKVWVGPTEPPRFIEKILRGHDYDTAPWLASRICGICWLPHFLASAQAVEDALEIQVTQQTRELREAAMLATMLQSHVQHAVLLSLPDLLRLPNAFPLIGSHPEVFALVRKLERLGNDITTVLTGRDVSGVSFTVGGVTHFPKESEIADLLARVTEAKSEILELARVYSTFLTEDRLLAFDREREFISLSPYLGEENYPYTDGLLCSNDTGSVPITMASYLNHTNERYVPGGTGKTTRHVRSSLTVGSLARVNNNYRFLAEPAKSVADLFGICVPDHRIAMNPAAQLVESVDAIYRLEDVLWRLFAYGVHEEPVVLPVIPERAVNGIGVVEAPRGILIHHYTIDKGKIILANCIVPTGQNYGSMQSDLEYAVPMYLREHLSDEEIRFRAEKIVRDHDPCNPCAVHFLRVK